MFEDVPLGYVHQAIPNTFVTRPSAGNVLNQQKITKQAPIVRVHRGSVWIMMSVITWVSPGEWPDAGTDAT